jgi:hypothetical protein
MVKVNFFKNMKNNMSLKKIFIILGLISVIIVILFSLTNEYSLENLTPLGPTIDVMLWTDAYGSTSNIFVNTYWLGLINTYKGFPNINFGQRKISEMVKYFEPEKNPQFNTWNEGAMASYVPCITILVDDKGVKSLLGAGATGGGFFTGPTLTLEHVMKSIAGVFSKNYDKLYSNSPSNAGMPAMPATPTTPTMPVVPWS